MASGQQQDEALAWLTHKPQPVLLQARHSDASKNSARDNGKRVAENLLESVFKLNVFSNFTSSLFLFVILNLQVIFIVFSNFASTVAKTLERQNMHLRMV